MGVLNKIFTAIRGGAREAGEAIVDANGVRIMEQEIKDAENHLEQAKRDLADVMAKEMQAGRRIEELKAEIVKYESYAEQALNKGDEALALDVAAKIADFASERELKEKEKASFGEHVARLKEMIKKTSASLNDLKRQLTMVRTTESVQKATRAITDNYVAGGSKLLSAKESLDRIKQRQQDWEDRMAAGETLQGEFSGGDLEERLKKAGVAGSQDAAKDVLARIKAKKTSGE
jgi:phage shock protein A